MMGGQTVTMLLVLALVAAGLLVAVVACLRLGRRLRDQEQHGRQLLARQHEAEEAFREARHASEQLAEANRTLAESNRVKDALVVQYMKLSRGSIAQLQSYQQMLQRLAATHSIDRLLETIKGAESFDAELDAFYDQFDDTFLSLYPTFVEELNAMISDGERYPLPVTTADGRRGALTTELRVFALMRLGVTDLDEIASFLRCAPKTVLNYRSRLRQRVNHDKDQLDQFLKNN